MTPITAKQHGPWPGPIFGQEEYAQITTTARNSIEIPCKRPAQFMQEVLPLISNLLMRSGKPHFLFFIIPASPDAAGQLPLLSRQPFLCFSIESRIVCFCSVTEDSHSVHGKINPENLRVFCRYTDCLVFTVRIR